MYNETPTVIREKITLPGAVRKASIKAHIQSESEKILTQLQAAEEKAKKVGEELKKAVEK